MPKGTTTVDRGLALQKAPALAQLPADVLDELERVARTLRKNAGDYLFRQGDSRLEEVFVLLTATAEVLVGPPDAERSVSLAGPGQLLGFLSVFSEERSPASARIARPGEVLTLPTASLSALADRDPSVARLIASTMAQRLQDVLHDVEVQATHTRLRRFETFPFRRRVSEVMSHSVLQVSPGDSARSVAERMQQSGDAAALVVDDGAAAGIVTERDLVMRVLAAGRDPAATCVAEVMSSPVHCIEPNEYLFRAMGVMRRRRILFLPVMLGRRFLGILSIRDLLALSSRETLSLLERIESAASILELADVRDRSREVALSLLAQNVPALEVSHALSALNREVHRKVVEVSLRQMAAQARGRPPLPFCFLLLGSHGRSENHFSTDQDHGLIFADPEPSQREAAERFFEELAERITEGLTKVGYPPCEGGVMCMNSLWRKSLSEWKDQVAGWLAEPDADAVRRFTIFFDFLPVWGDSTLAAELRSFVTSGMRQNVRLLRLLFTEAAHHKVPLTLFKGFVTEKSGPRKGQLDLKTSGLRFVVECARILALLHGVDETGTIERIAELERLGVVPPEEGRFVRNAYESFFRLLLSSQAAALKKGAAADHYVKPSALPIEERYLLRLALEATERLQTLVHARIHTPFVPGLAPPAGP